MKVFAGTNGKFGVEDNGILYEAEFSKAVATAIVKMEKSKNPPEDWTETKARLIEMGFKESEL